MLDPLTDLATKYNTLKTLNKPFLEAFSILQIIYEQVRWTNVYDYDEKRK